MGAVLDVGQREVAEQRECERARDRRGRKEERVGSRALRKQLRALIHAETLLLVDHRKREVRGRDVVLEERMRADEHVELT